MKNGASVLWCLTDTQFTALCRGFWYADGEHGQAKDGSPRSFRICNTNKKLLDLLILIVQDNLKYNEELQIHLFFYVL